MKVAIIGATGFVGSAVVTEGIEPAGTKLTAIVRDTARK
jgi:putative NADH-flavin reductase